MGELERDKQHRQDAALADRDASGDLVRRSPQAELAPEVVENQARLWQHIAATPGLAPEDAAAAAIDRKGTGDTVDPALAAQVGGQTGVDVSMARIHKDPLSRQATRTMQARAFAHGNDVFLGPGEREDDTQLMAHELTHVAQQQAAVQRKPTVGAANSPAEEHADMVAAKVAAGAPPEHLIDEAQKPAFLATLRGAIERVVDHELNKLGATTECPFIDGYFAKYADEPAATIEALLRKWLPNAKFARSASDLIPLVTVRVREGVQSWSAGGRLPPDIVAMDPALAAVDRQGAPAPAGSLQRMEAELGAGQPLDGAQAARMSSLLGADVSGVQVHTGATAQRMAAEHDALAFTVGQNIVMGAHAPTSGMHGDALLAHELVHTLQQKDAAADPVARRKPIGPEDAAAEENAGLARLSTFGGALGDVMRTGLQLQRCPGSKEPEGPPMQGKEADTAIANTPEVANFTHNDVMGGITGENRVHLHDDFNDYVQAWYTDSLPVQLYFPKGLQGAELEKARRELARQLAEDAPGFTNPQSRVIHIYTKGTPKSVTIHELMHAYTHTAAFQLGDVFTEGSAQYFAHIICMKNSIPFAEGAYHQQFVAVSKLAAIIGDDGLARVTFHGEIDVAKVAVDSKGAGTWKRWLRALRAKHYDDAASELDGVKEANDKRLAAEEAAQHEREQKDKREAEAARAKDRASWPPEATGPMHARILNRRVVGGTLQLGVGVGGARGVREGWTAHAKLSGGGTIDAPIVAVDHSFAYFEVASVDIAEHIQGEVEVRPKSQ